MDTPAQFRTGVSGYICKQFKRGLSEYKKNEIKEEGDSSGRWTVRDKGAENWKEEKNGERGKDREKGLKMGKEREI